MPLVNIKILKGRLDTAKKARLIKGATDLLLDVAGVPPEMTWVVIEELDAENWGTGGESLAEQFKRNK